MLGRDDGRRRHCKTLFEFPDGVGPEPAERLGCSRVQPLEVATQPVTRVAQHPLDRLVRLRAEQLPEDLLASLRVRREQLPESALRQHDDLPELIGLEADELLGGIVTS